MCLCLCIGVRVYVDRKPVEVLVEVAFSSTDRNIRATQRMKPADRTFDHIVILKGRYKMLKCRVVADLAGVCAAFVQLRRMYERMR